MRCPKCKSESVYVTDTMPGDDGRIYRRKRCEACNFRFNTVEVTEAEYTTNWLDALQSIVNHGSEDFKRGYYAAYHKKHLGRGK